eukprot:8659061-Alexandrium_andersonii.AAC.1
MQSRAPETACEVRRFPRQPLKSWAPISANSEPQIGRVGPLGELGPRPPRGGLGRNSKLDL